MSKDNGKNELRRINEILDESKITVKQHEDLIFLTEKIVRDLKFYNDKDVHHKEIYKMLRIEIETLKSVILMMTTQEKYHPHKPQENCWVEWDRYTDQEV